MASTHVVTSPWVVQRRVTAVAGLGLLQRKPRQTQLVYTSFTVRTSWAPGPYVRAGHPAH